MIPEFVVLGHITRDEQPGGSFTLGGAATFAAIAARNLGYRAGILTCAADDFPQPELLHDIQLVRLDSATTTTFRNVYHGSKRQQHVRDVAGPLRAADVPPAWRAAKIALLGPLAGELDVDMAHAFSGQTLLAVSPQGWMRQWDESGRVQPRAWERAEEILPHIQVLIMSEEDIRAHAERLPTYLALTPLVVLTHGAEGCMVYQGQQPPRHFPAFPIQVVDPTGAGDSFAAGFLIRYLETGDIAQAARFGNATAALAIASYGAATMPTRAQVEELLSTGADR